MRNGDFKKEVKKIAAIPFLPLDNLEESVAEIRESLSEDGKLLLDDWYVAYLGPNRTFVPSVRIPLD